MTELDTTSDQRPAPHAEPATTRPPIPHLTHGELALVYTAVTTLLAVGTLGLYASFESVTTAATRWHFTTPQVLPIAIDLAIPGFTIAHLLLIRLDMELAWVRAVPWTLTAVTVYLNIQAGTTLPAQIGHGALPLVWVVCSEIAAHVYRARIGAVTGKRMERVRRSRWLLAPVSTGSLWRRMILWEETSYLTAIRRERDRKLARAAMRQQYGLLWRAKAPRRLRVLLTMGELAPGSFDINESAAARPQHVICAGPTGVLFLRRPEPLKTAAPWKAAGPVGSRIVDLEPVLAGQHAPVVYFIRNGDRIKIGTSTNLRARVRRLCLRIDDIALVLHGSQAYERQLHDRFAEHRAGDTEWFELAGELAAFVAAGGGEVVASPGAGAGDEVAATGADSGDSTSLPTGASDSDSERQDEATPDASDTNGGGDSIPAEVATPPRQRQPRPAANPRKKAVRRSMTEWVDLAGPIFHSEFERLHRQPTGDEFADAIKKAGYGTVSASTAKNIRTEILDRSPLPALD